MNNACLCGNPVEIAGDMCHECSTAATEYFKSLRRETEKLAAYMGDGVYIWPERGFRFDPHQEHDPLEFSVSAVTPEDQNSWWIAGPLPSMEVAEKLADVAQRVWRESHDWVQVAEAIRLSGYKSAID